MARGLVAGGGGRAWPHPRLNRHLSHPDHSSGEVKASEEVDGAAIVACGDMAKMLELVEETLDAITKPVGQGVMRDADLAVRSGWNDGFGASLGDELAQGVGVIGFVGD